MLCHFLFTFCGCLFMRSPIMLHLLPNFFCKHISSFMSFSLNLQGNPMEIMALLHCRTRIRRGFPYNCSNYNIAQIQTRIPIPMAPLGIRVRIRVRQCKRAIRTIRTKQSLHLTTRKSSCVTARGVPPTTPPQDSPPG